MTHSDRKYAASRVPLLEDAQTEPDMQAFFGQVRQRGAEPLNLHRTLAHAPPYFAAARHAAFAIRDTGELPRDMRELAIIRGAQLNGGFYEEAQHRPMALSCGLTPAQLDAIRHWTHSSEFSHAQRALLGYVDAMFGCSGRTGRATTPMQPPPACFQRAKCSS